MAESTSSSSSSPTTPPASKSTQYVAPVTDDDRLEVDALRGSEHHLQQSGVEDLNDKRTKELEAKQKKSA